MNIKVLLILILSSDYQDVASFSYVSKRTSTSRNKKVTEKLSRKERTVVILYHKPKGVITSHSSNDPLAKDSEKEERVTVYDDIMSMKGFISPNLDADSSSLKSFEQVTGITSKLHAIGRLDADTTGLLLLTNDGGLVHHVTNPSASTSKNGKLIKTYEAVIMGHHTLSDDSLDPLLKGVDIGAKYGGMTLPANDVKILGHPSPKSTRVMISISEGRNRQVRRMFHAIRSGVMQLKRQRVGNIDLDMLQGGEGSWRVLNDDEVLKGLGWKSRILDEERKYKTPHSHNKSISKTYKRSKRKKH
jgi:23S rRNA pseudouridine2605 synthase